jgi:hypothetical protein
MRLSSAFASTSSWNMPVSERAFSAVANELSIVAASFSPIGESGANS